VPDGVNGEASKDSPSPVRPTGVTEAKSKCDEGDGVLMLVDAAGGEPRRAAAAHDGPIRDAGRFSPGGPTVLTSVDGRIVILDLDGTVLQTITEPGASLFGPVWSPDGSGSRSLVRSADRSRISYEPAGRHRPTAGHQDASQ
jgi:hypothetical protein